MIYINDYKVEIGNFPNNESFIDLVDGTRNLLTSKAVKIIFFYENDSEFFGLQLIKDYLDDMNIKASLLMPYVPYSRMDRKENSRMFSLKTFAKMINNMNFTSVTIYEPHSDVAPALIDRVRVVNYTSMLLKKVLIKMMPKVPNDEDEIFNWTNENNVYIVFPDAGAQKRYTSQIKYPKCITCSKHRDFNTGKIDGFSLNNVPENIPKDFTAIIMDDLCSKGGTFVATANELKNVGAGNIYLIVTHTENTILNGNIPSSDLIEKVYTTNSLYTGHDDKIEVFEI